MIMCVLLCYPVSIHMSQLLSTGRPISSFRLSLLSRGATEQSTLAERGEFHENSTPILRVDYSCIYNNL